MVNAFMIRLSELAIDMHKPVQWLKETALPLFLGIPVLVLLGIPLGIFGTACFAWRRLNR